MTDNLTSAHAADLPDRVRAALYSSTAPRCAYVRDKCLTQEPPLTPDADDASHTFRCWYPVGSPEYLEKRVELEARRAAEVSAREQDELTITDDTAGVI